ncbi:MAG: hypothetical protein JWN70_5871 [Planctomycetaceae bacterium]|nr:hypothetical protein [Planctomycetaceae bacterium]
MPVGFPKLEKNPGAYATGLTWVDAESGGFGLTGVANNHPAYAGRSPTKGSNNVRLQLLLRLISRIIILPPVGSLSLNLGVEFL